MAPKATRYRAPVAAQAAGFAWLALCSSIGLITGCNKPSSDNIQLWKTTEKGPERLHDALADHGVEPRLRAEAAVALVDIGRAEEVDTTIQALPPDDREAIAKNLEPLCEVAMKDPSPDKALAYRDALYSLRQFVPPDEQKRIAEAYIAQLDQSKVFPRQIVTKAVPLQGFYPAEAYHQNYAALHPNQPYIVFNDAPKVEHLRQEFPDLYTGK